MNKDADPLRSVLPSLSGRGGPPRRPSSSTTLPPFHSTPYPPRSLVSQTSERFLRLTSNTNTNGASSSSAASSSASNNNVCSICNGYYGPAFNQPVCATCHAFLYAQDSNPGEPGSGGGRNNWQQLMSGGANDLEPEGLRGHDDDSDRDSGNDEPTDGDQEFLIPAPVPVSPPQEQHLQQVDAAAAVEGDPFPDPLLPVAQEQQQQQHSDPPAPLPQAAAQQAEEHHQQQQQSAPGELSAQFQFVAELPADAIPVADPDVANDDQEQPMGVIVVPEQEAVPEPDAARARVEDLAEVIPPDEEREELEYLSAAAVDGAYRSGGAAGGFSSQPPGALAAHVDSLFERLSLLTEPRPGDQLPEGIVDSVPTEVLLFIFSFLDDISLYAVGNVCRRWHMLQSEMSAGSWQAHTRRRWPLFLPITPVHDWFATYSTLTESSFCLTCIYQMAEIISPPTEDHLPPSRLREKRMAHDLRGLVSDPLDGIKAQPLDSSIYHWQASITGPVGSPYEGGIFYLYLKIPFYYPFAPPKVRFLTKIFHPNVSMHGDIGIDNLHHNWVSGLTIPKVLLSIQSLLTDPFCDVCMEPEIGKLYREDRRMFDAVARTWTWKFAMHDFVLPNRRR